MLIGKEIVVLASRDKSMLNLKGLVINETKNLLVVATTLDKEIKVPKSIVTVSVINGKKDNIVLEGSKLLGTAADRIKG